MSSNTTMLTMGAPGCCAHPYGDNTLTHDCAAPHCSNRMIKFTDDVVLIRWGHRQPQSKHQTDHRTRNASTFYRNCRKPTSPTTESVLSRVIIVCFGKFTAVEWKALQWIVQLAGKITRAPLSSVSDIYTTHCLRKAKSIVKNTAHPSHGLFSFQPSGRRYRQPCLKLLEPP